MDLDTIIHSFIVKVHIEGGDAGAPSWHGQITHVASGERRYIKDLGEIPDFIAPYLLQVGIKLGLRWQLAQRFNQFKAYLKSNLERFHTAL